MRQAHTSIFDTHIGRECRDSSRLNKNIYSLIMGFCKGNMNGRVKRDETERAHGVGQKKAQTKSCREGERYRKVEAPRMKKRQNVIHKDSRTEVEIHNKHGKRRESMARDDYSRIALQTRHEFTIALAKKIKVSQFTAAP